MYGEPRAVHEKEEARHHRGAADEGSGQRGEAPQTDGEVQYLFCLLQGLKRYHLFIPAENDGFPVCPSGA